MNIVSKIFTLFVRYDLALLKSPKNKFSHKTSSIHTFSFGTIFKVLIFIFILRCFPSNAQDSLLLIKCPQIKVDNIGNIYAINKDVITKYFTNQQIKTFSIKTYGTLTNIDVSNALRILLYFNDFQKILFLDSQLSQNGDVIELSQLGYEQTLLVCSSFNNGFWIYHQANNELIRFNQSLEISIKTGNLKRILSQDIRPNFMLEHNGKLYLNSPNIGILVFDIYGSYLKTIPLKNLNSFQIHYPYIFYLIDTTFCSYSIETFENIDITTIPSTCKNLLFNGTNCYWHFDDYIKINQCIK